MKKLKHYREFYDHYTDRAEDIEVVRSIIEKLNNRFNTKEYAKVFSFAYLAATKEYTVLRKLLNRRLRNAGFQYKVAVSYANGNKYAEFDDVFNVMYRLRDVVYVMASNTSGKIKKEHWDTLLYIIKSVYAGSPALLKDTHLPTVVEIQLDLLADIVNELNTYNLKEDAPHRAKLYRRSWEIYAIQTVSGLITKSAKFKAEWGHVAFQSRAVNVSYWKQLAAWYQEKFQNNSRSKPASKVAATTLPKEKKSPELKILQLKQNCPDMTINLSLTMALKVSTTEDTIKVAVEDIYAVEDNLALKLENGLAPKEISLQGLLSFNEAGALTVNTSTLRSRVARYNAQEQQLLEEHKKAKVIAELKDKLSGVSPEAKAFLDNLLSTQGNKPKL